VLRRHRVRRRLFLCNHQSCSEASECCAAAGLRMQYYISVCKYIRAVVKDMQNNMCIQCTTGLRATVRVPFEFSR